MVARPNKPDDIDTGDFSDPEADVEPDREGGFYVVSPEEGRSLFDQWARQDLGISGEEFLRRLDNGEYQTVSEDTLEGRRIVGMMMLLPFARPTSF